MMHVHHYTRKVIWERSYSQYFTHLTCIITYIDKETTDASLGNLVKV